MQQPRPNEHLQRFLATSPHLRHLAAAAAAAAAAMPHHSPEAPSPSDGPLGLAQQQHPLFHLQRLQQHEAHLHQQAEQFQFGARPGEGPRDRFPMDGQPDRGYHAAADTSDESHMAADTLRQEEPDQDSGKQYFCGLY